MKTKKHQWILYLISLTIVATIGVQFYWNYNNYKENKQRISNEIQLSLDNAIEEYYAKLAKDEITTIVKFENNKTDSLKLKNLNSIFYHPKGVKNLKTFIQNDSSILTPSYEIADISIVSSEKLDLQNTDVILKDFAKEISLKQDSKDKEVEINLENKNTKIKYFSSKKTSDSLKIMKNLKPIFLSVTSGVVDYNQLDSLIQKQLKQKKIPVNFTFNHLKNDTLFYASNLTSSKKNVKSISSKSTFLRNNEEFKLLYNNISFEALKRSSLGILISFLLSIAVISSLFYLLKTINQQKELAAIKNDLISNITHEFKTPIATVATAIEAIENFNVLEDKKKTQKYLSMSSLQLKKLHQMVEKLLETATLDSEQLMLKKENIDVVDLIEKLVYKHQLLTNSKKLNFSTNLKPLYLTVDAFHFENTISNLIDNAVKYGGNHIEININSVLKSTEISIADDGNGIEKNQQEKIFDKFYRVPKGNKHDVKGFGIGLYYCKKIIEKHNGKIAVSSENEQTVFKINISNE